MKKWNTQNKRFDGIVPSFVWIGFCSFIVQFIDSEQKNVWMNLKSMALSVFLELIFFLLDRMQICSLFCDSICGDNYEWLLDWLYSIKFFFIDLKCKQNNCSSDPIDFGRNCCAVLPFLAFTNFGYVNFFSGRINFRNALSKNQKINKTTLTMLFRSQDEKIWH